MQPKPRTSWPKGVLPIAMVIWLVIIGAIILTVEGRGTNMARFVIALGIAGVGIGRWILAQRRAEQSRAWRFYLGMIILAPFVSLAIVALWEALR